MLITILDILNKLFIIEVTVLNLQNNLIKAIQPSFGV